MIVEDLYELQVLDSHLSRLERALAALDDGARVQELAERAAAEEAAVTAERRAKQSRLQDLELELQSVVEKRRRIEQDLYSGRIGNPKELSAMQADVDLLGRQRQRLEDEMLALMDELERLDERSGVLALQRQARQRELEDHLLRHQEQARAITAEIAAVRRAREAKAAAIDPEVLRRYERLRQRKDGVAVAAVTHGICEGCHVAIPEGRVAQILEGERLYTCEECGRILYVSG
ncbi:MAG: C4-type zinc ribbon domain-containing protein [Armatimonadota bacterium]|nr:C4-type zinc ribbon domain-containing protein [Armatimonadota bacterium]MDR7468151.1 C4-type zinc ribbon domain-containing protein [Armatimonadota bacterium]MDR7495145.1 C4-type zinc ribbon domain-containing protein [Armatimonadota bacterium]MDR7499279.1 C4-type zinc ribbon domain-containing protein [Armatimonadota bacterium]MDR7505103.1 C4-type zinc ribbon domain-containing protein [Armatimonadota bacterium]